MMKEKRNLLIEHESRCTKTKLTSNSFSYTFSYKYFRLWLPGVKNGRVAGCVSSETEKDPRNTHRTWTLALTIWCSSSSLCDEITTKMTPCSSFLVFSMSSSSRTLLLLHLYGKIFGEHHTVTFLKLRESTKRQSFSLCRK
jgi:hypothetical protein